MLTPPAKSLPLSIAAKTGKAQLSKHQKTFNGLIKQIEQGRARLAAWDVAIPRYQQKHTAELQPLIDKIQALEASIAQALDQAHGQSGLTKTERRKIAGIIVEITDELLAEQDDADLKALYNKHSGLDYDEVRAEDQATLKSAVEEILGFDLGDDFDLSSPEGLMEKSQEKIREQQAQLNAAREARIEREAHRKKSPKQLAKEAREAADEQQLKQSIREIYRKLASALHPDREPDPQERARKTALMQKVNQAYDKNNLLQLLELQLELEQIDQDHINNVSEERLKHYNKILREQLGELHHEIVRVEAGFMAQFMFDPFEEPDPHTILKSLSVEIAEVQREIRELQRDLAACEDIKKLKLWLKNKHQPKRRERFDDVLF
jgi:hypothetical protein